MRGGSRLNKKEAIKCYRQKSEKVSSVWKKDMFEKKKVWVEEVNKSRRKLKG